MLRLTSLLQAMFLVIVAAISCVHGLELQDSSTELLLRHLDDKTADMLPVQTELQDGDLRESRRSLLQTTKKKITIKKKTKIKEKTKSEVPAPEKMQKFLTSKIVAPETSPKELASIDATPISKLS